MTIVIVGGQDEDQGYTDTMQTLKATRGEADSKDLHRHCHSMAVAK